MKMDGGGGMGGGADLSDIRYDAFLLNGKSVKTPWTLASKPGERIRLRFIYAGASTYFKVRVELVMKDTTMMWHPMHLHGHFFRVLQGAGGRSPLKHTVNMAPSETVTIEFAPTTRDAGSSTATTSTTSRPAWRASSSTSPERSCLTLPPVLPT